MISPPGAGPYADLLGATVVRATDAEYEVAMDADARHTNQFGVLHGGLQMSLLDMAMGSLVARSLAPGETTASVSIATEFLAGGRAGRVVAKARLVKRGKTVAFPEAELVDAAGRVLSRASGVWVIRRDG
ncbi:MAG TPA: PaaI family thioesterase [Candidatus Thermoplasmatota archaeon]|nr:PaaI family thioesterase [Candidatus Thermoplasmatota archaeon]